MNVRRILTALIAVMLFLGLAWQCHDRAPRQAGKGVHLARVLPLQLSGWQSRTLELGPQEAVAATVRETLRFDDVFFREYRQSSLGAFSVYVAYWAPGKMPVQLVASHVPDRCWTGAGWSCFARNYHLALAVPGLTLREAQGRSFRDPTGRVQEVAYWHLIGHRLYDFGERLNQRPDALKWWREVVRSVWARPKEQYFIRLASDRPFEELVTDPGFQEMLAAVAKLGLAAEPRSGETVKQ